MKKPVQIALIVAVVALAGASAVLFAQYQKSQQQLARTSASEQEVQDRYGRTIDAIAEIQDSLNALALDEGGTPLSPGGVAAERRMGGPNSQESLDRIALLRSSIEKSKERIRELESNLKDRGVKVASLERLIANLKRSVADKEQLVAMLSGRVDQLETEVGGLTVAVAEKSDTLRTREVQLEESRRDNATVFYVVGTKKQLKEAGVIASTGGVLGIGKTVLPAATPNSAAFTPIDTDQQDVIVFPAEKARVISAQPSSSYQLVTTNGQTELRILSPIDFRKVKQVVILTG
jgi:uncharacterized protein (DUF3084 family)